MIYILQEGDNKKGESQRPEMFFFIPRKNRTAPNSLTERVRKYIRNEIGHVVDGTEGSV